MYSVNINLLKDRPGFARDDAARGTMSAGPVDKTPMWIGGLVGAGAVGLTLLGFAGANFRTQMLQTENSNLDAKLQALDADVKRLEQIKADEQKVVAETQALATIFNQIKPWSAMMQDVRDRVPSTLQIAEITQAAPPAPAPNAAGGAAPGTAPAPAPNAAGTAAPAGAAAPMPPAGTALTLTGKARSFSDINDFVLSLKRSPFLVSDKTQLVSSERERRNSRDSGQAELITYEIRTALSTVTASDLLQELRLKGATGLTSRIDFLKQKGVIQK
jgi:type IV pilus assembly protein PilN